MTLKHVFWWIFVFLAVGVGLYPFLYFFADMSGGLLGTKPIELLESQLYKTGFYLHIILGGIALLIGWAQFSKRLRSRYVEWHRTMGKFYLEAVLVSALAGFYIAFYATGGFPSQLGFQLLALAWLSTTVIAFIHIRKADRDVDAHQQWMIRSYALCFAAVTLRLWLPLLTGIFGMTFLEAYPLVAWLCWLPNVVVAEVFIRFL